MKKMTFIAAICLMLAATALAQSEITPRQLKMMRSQVYRWVNTYIERSDLNDGNVSKRRYLSQFENGSTLIVNDYLPLCNDESIQAESYYSLMTKEGNVYRSRVTFGDVKVVRESLAGKNYSVTLSIEKTISFADKNGVFMYPSKQYVEVIVLTGDLDNEKPSLLCESITTNDKLQVDYVFHNPNSNPTNIYVSDLSTVAKENDAQPALIITTLKSTDFDSKMMVISRDTLKNKIAIKPFAGVSFWATSAANRELSNLSSKTTLSYGLFIEYYRQLFLKESNRFGLILGLGISQSRLSISSDYLTTYSAVDPDGGHYLRTVDINNLKESIKRAQLYIPISFRYDRFITERFSVFGNVGFNLNFDIKQSAHLEGHAKYSGYYDWLFNVTIEQNGIYDFGTFDVSTIPSDIAIGKLGLGAFAGVGVQYIFPKSKCSLEFEVQYGNVFYNPLKKSSNQILSNDKDDWRSMSNQLKQINLSDLRFMVEFGWNF